MHKLEPRARNGGRTESSSGLPESPCALCLDLSSVKLGGILESLLDQVDWLEVTAKVAQNRPPSVYCQAVEKIFLAQIDRLREGEDRDAVLQEKVQRKQGYEQARNSEYEHEPLEEESKLLTQGDEESGGEEGNYSRRQNTDDEEKGAVQDDVGMMLDC